VFIERTFDAMARESSLTEQRLRLIYTGEGFGGDNTLRAKVIRELIDEIHALREELRGVGSTAQSSAPGADGPGDPRESG
jgi:hypothetical protein